MVEYDTWIAIVFEYVKVELNVDITFNEAQNVTSVAAEVWNDRRDELLRASRSEAMEIARSEVDA